MSKRRLLMLFERNGRGWSGLAAVLPDSVIAELILTKGSWQR